MFLLSACRQVPQFPNRPLKVLPNATGDIMLAFDTNKDRKPDYWQRQSENGIKVELRFTVENDSTATVVMLDEIDPNSIPHFIIALDGVPFQLVRELYDQGCFRLFYPPSKMVSTFPAMTDLAFWQVFGGKQPLAYQAKHFDRGKNRIISGNDIYLSGDAADWVNKLDYRCSFLLDMVAYSNPDLVFEHELRGMMEIFRQANSGTKIVYSVGTAGLGTEGGREAILKYLRTIDRLCEQIVYERKGRVNITLMADHGHNMFGRGRVSFEQLLRENGYNLTNRMKKNNDVVTIEFGLVTYAAFFTNDPGGLANVLLQNPVTTIACYPESDHIIVQSIDGKAVIRKTDNRFSYNPITGDPLKLSTIIDKLRNEGKVDPQGFIDDLPFFEATVDHFYPDPLHRIWQAFHSLVQKPADLIVCLKDGWVHGSKLFDLLIGGATSTHGSLNRINSMTFAMSMLGPLPAAMRLNQLLPVLNTLKKTKPSMPGKNVLHSH